MPYGGHPFAKRADLLEQDLVAYTDQEVAASKTMSGTTAARPAPSAANAGVLYFSTTDNSLARSYGTAWVNVVAAELGYASITAQQTTASGTLVDVSGLSLSFTVGARNVLLECGGQTVKNNNAAGAVQIALIEGSTSLGECLVQGPAWGAWYASARLTPSAGSHTYKVQWAVVAAGTNTMGFNATSTYPIGWIRGREL